MRSLIGYLKKILLLISLSFLFFSFSKTITFAEENTFKVSSYFTHTINESTIDTRVIIQLNTDITRVLSIYTATIQAKNIAPKCYINGTEEIECKKYNRLSVTDIQIDFNNRVITPESTLELILTYSTPYDNNISYSIPSHLLDAETKEVVIKYPKSKGEFSWVSENVTNKNHNNQEYIITFKNPKEPEISIFFTDGIQYKFTVNKVFTNPNDQIQTFELVLPMDSENQVVIWENISPLPTYSSIDDDGNYIFSYLVEAKQTVDCNIVGYIQKINNIKADKEILSFLTKEGGYWEILDKTEIKRVISFMKDKGLIINENAKDIKLLKDNQKSTFYKYLYQYVIYRLNYKEDIKLGDLQTTRVGASTVIKDANNANPIDFADFYMALLRHFSVPSRMVLGYIPNISSYTTDGFYHYWVEYFDFTRNEWITADPFLEKYLKKPFFGRQLADHVTILKRGKTPLTPTLTFYTPTDFLLSVDDSEYKEKNLSINANLSTNNYDISQKHLKAYINLSNNGNIAISDISFKKSSFGTVTKYIDSVNNTTSSLLLPKQNLSIQLNIPYEKINSSEVYITGEIKNITGDTQNIIMRSQIPNGIPNYIIIISKILSILTFIAILLIFYVLFKIGKRFLWTQQQ